MNSSNLLRCLTQFYLICADLFLRNMLTIGDVIVKSAEKFRWAIKLFPLLLSSFSYCEVEPGVHVLKVEPACYEMRIVRAEGRQTVLELSDGAVAAVNGGFFSAEGEPRGILKIDGIWHALPTEERGAIGWKVGGTTTLFDRVLTVNARWESMENIVGGAPLLIKNGRKITDFSCERTLDSFLTLPHARTAVGVDCMGTWVFVAVDAPGMVMSELADLMETLNCLNALNLDGGGSTTLVIENKVMNSPLGDGDFDDLGELKLRPVSDAITIYKKN